MDSEAFFVNTSPIIFMFAIGRLDWLPQIAVGRVVVPKAVRGEIEAGEGGADIMRRIDRHNGFVILDDKQAPSYVTAWDLGAGETQVLAHCCGHTKPVAILDDLAARKCATSLGIRLVGTLGLVLIAKQRQWIPAVRPVFQELRQNGMFLSQDLTDRILSSIGE